jgi:acyl transferase domain-containing protein/NADPH:quinone reductase-like Zn-dependent oxidoreductase/acyl carrier protein
MPDNASHDRRELVREALRTIDELHARLEAAQSALTAPVAIIGIGCRYPGGVTGPDSFWRLLARGGDAVTDAPADRWATADWFDSDPAAAGKTSSRWGGFLDRIDEFDAQFFGIAPREAVMLDPQHRLALEVAVEALEHAGQRIDRLAGSRTGIFLGMTTQEYYQHLLRMLPPAALSAYVVTGNVMNAAAGRIAYVLGANGPSIVVDTACSSSLTAIHLACQSLRAGDCGMALAGGVNLALAPQTSVMFSKWGMMAADGRCKAFDAAADGFVRSDGCGILVLKPLAAAIDAGDRVLAVIEGSAINQDGRSSGLTVPNGVAQEALIRQALASAGLSPADIDYVEAHGTGTRLGDPIEIDALSAVFTPGRGADRKLRIGSVKTNIGHAESASGVAGVIKCVLALEREEIPPQVHFRQPTPEIEWDQVAIEVVDRLLPWPKEERRRRAGVSSFGFSGANAHLILGEAPAPPPPPLDRRQPQLLTLSARDPQALKALARRYSAALLQPDAPPLADFCFSANTGRAAYHHRAFACGQTHAELAAGLSRLADEESKTPPLSGHWAGEPPKVAFLFTGQGAQYVGMGRRLYDAEPVFRAEMDRCAALLTSYLDRPLLDVCFDAAIGDRLLHQTRYTQPALFSLEWSLAQLWRSFGVVPDAMLGHSLGEYVAACQAGIMSLEDGLRFVAGRAALMQSLAPDGMMAAVSADEATVERFIAPHAASVGIAAVNGPRKIVVSGKASTIVTVLQAMEAQRITALPLTVSHAFHSPSMDPILDALETLAGQIAMHPPGIVVVSNLTGHSAGSRDLASASYWRRHARAPVRFADGVEALKRLGCRAFVEIGPAQVLINMARGAENEDDIWLPSMAPGWDDCAQLLNAIGALFIAGRNIDWAGVYRGRSRRHCVIPTYPFQRKRFWMDAPQEPQRSSAPAGFVASPRCPLVREAVFSGQLSILSEPWLADHIVAGEVIVPMTAFVTMALAAAREVLANDEVALQDVVIAERATMNDHGALALQLVFSPEPSGGAWAFKIISLNSERRDGYVAHASGLAIRRTDGAAAPITVEDATEMFVLDGGRHLDAFRSRGIEFGAAFRGVIQVRHKAGVAIGEIDRGGVGLFRGGGGLFHPALLDVCLQPLVHVWPEGALANGLLPFSIERVEILRAPTARMTSHCVARHAAGGSDAMTGDVAVCDEQGAPLVLVKGLSVRPWSASAGRIDHLLYEQVWRRSGKTAPDLAGVSDEAMRNRPGYLDEAARLDYAGLAGLLQRRALFHIVGALSALRWSPAPGETVTAVALVRALGVEARYRQLVDRFCEILSEAGYCEKNGSGWIMRRALDEGALLTESGASGTMNVAAPELRLLERSGKRLADVLTGRADPLELLFGPDVERDLETIYAKSVTTSAVNRLAADIVVSAAEQNAQTQAFRVLEIGAGTGGTTGHILGRLPKDGVEYCFTDISPLLVARARTRFADHAMVTFETLDIERDPGAQGFSDRRFDLILAANVLHATAELRAVLARTRALLEPGGLLVLIEGTRRQSWIDVTFGLTDGWWKVADAELRGGYPLLGVPEWRRLLQEQGFSTPACLGGPAVEGQDSDYTVFVASASPDETPVSDEATWLLFAEAEDGDLIAAELRRKGHSCIVVRPSETGFEAIGPDVFGVRPAVRGDYQRLMTAIAESGRTCCGVAHLWFLAAGSAPDFSPPDIVEAQRPATESLLYLSQSLAARGMALTDGLWLATRGAEAVGADVCRLNPEQAPAWGFAKTLALEHPELNVHRIDLDPSPTSGTREAADLVEMMLAASPPAECALRGDRRYEPELVRWTDKPQTPVGLTVTTPGRLDALQWQEISRRPPGAGEVEIEVEAIGLNFRDVLSVLDMYHGEGSGLGGEVAGTIVALGPGIRDLTVGDHVAAFAFGGFSSFVTTHADLTLRKPGNWSFADIATVPVAFATAHHALVDCARVQAGERVLIHAASGAVGLAAIRLAQELGCAIVATAGSGAKRDYLRSCGVEHVFDSRSLSFVEGVRSIARDGVDLILNTLAGDFVGASLELLNSNGRFVELGRRALWAPEHAAAIRPSATYFGVDLATLARKSPEAFRPIFSAASRAIANGTLRPLPVQLFQASEAQDAFRFMAQARHIGKVIVTPPRLAPASDVRPSAFSARADAAYLITGGLTGLGLRTAEWLAARGARHLALVGRSAPTGPAEKALGVLRSAGMNVMTIQADVGVKDDIDRLFAVLRASLPPLRGIVHSAGVLNDGAIIRQTWPRMREVLGPKVAGAWNLHAASLDLPLDFFICYSSASAILGSPGQSAHAAANSYLDALVHHRRGLGLPGLSIDWGVWSDIGAAAGADVTGRVGSLGVEPMTPGEGLAALERLILCDAAQATAVRMRWDRFVGLKRPIAELKPFSGLVRQPTAGVAPAAGPVRPEQPPEWAALSPSPRRRAVEELIRTALTSVLDMEPGAPIDPHQGLRDFGLDSLMSIELRNRLQSAVGRPLPATLAFDYPTFSALVDHVCDGFAPGAESRTTGRMKTPVEAPEDSLADLLALSADQAEALLIEELMRTRELLS